MECSKAGTQNFIPTRLACFLGFVFMVIGISPVVAATPYVFAINLEEELESPRPLALENSDKRLVVYTPTREEVPLLSYTDPSPSIDVVCPDLDLLSKCPAHPLNLQPHLESLVEPEIDLAAPKGAMDFATDEPNWHISPVNKEIEPVDFFYEGLLLQSEKKTNYLEQIEFGKTLVDTTTRYRESLFAASYFQLEKDSISTNFSHLIRSSENDLDQKLLLDTSLTKNLSPQDPLSLKAIQVSSQLEKTSTNRVVSFAPIALPKTGISWTVHLYSNKSPYLPNYLENLQYEPIRPKSIQAVFSSADILKTVLDINACKVSQELLSGVYETAEVQDKLQLTVDRYMQQNHHQNIESRRSVFILAPTHFAVSSIYGCLQTKKDLPSRPFTANLEVLSNQISKFSSYANALTTEIPRSNYHPTLQQPYWSLKIPHELTTLTREPVKHFILKANEIEVASLEVPLFSGVTRPVFARLQKPNLSLNQITAHPIKPVRLDFAKADDIGNYSLAFEKPQSDLSHKTLTLDLVMPAKNNLLTAFLKETNPPLPVQANYANCYLTTSPTQNIFSLSPLDLPNSSPLHKMIPNVSIQTRSTHFSKGETSQLFLKDPLSTPHTIDLDFIDVSQEIPSFYGSILSKNSLDIITTNENYAPLPPPEKSPLHPMTSFDKNSFLVISISPFKISQSEPMDIDLFPQEVTDIHIETNHFAPESNIKVMTLVESPLNRSHQLHAAYGSIELLDSKPYEMTYCFGSSAVDTNRSNRVTHLLLSSLPTLSELETDNFDDDFMCEVQVAPHMSQDGYIFSARFTSNDKDGIDAIPHRVIYLLDRGSAIEAHRFDVFKNAIVKSINQLNPSTLFNVWAFDQKIDILHPQDLYNTKASINLTKQRMAKLPQGRRASFSTLAQALQSLNQKALESNELYTVILLSDGSIMKNIRFHRESLLELAKIDASAISLYTAAVSDNNNLRMLELLAHVGHGDLCYIKTHASFPRRFAQLVRRVSKPLVTGLHVTCFSDNPSVSLQHMNVVSEQLYADQGYLVHGSTSDLSPIHIIIQGERNGRYVNIHKKIPLKNNIAGQIRTEKTYYTRKALSEMIEFIFSNDQTHLIRAKELLSPYGETFASTSRGY